MLTTWDTSETHLLYFEGNFTDVSEQSHKAIQMLLSTTDTFTMFFASWSLTALMTEMVIAFIVRISPPFEGESELLLPPQEKAEGKHWPSRGLGETKNWIPKFIRRKNIYYLTDFPKSELAPWGNPRLGAAGQFFVHPTPCKYQTMSKWKENANTLESHGTTGLCCLNISPKRLCLQDLSFYSVHLEWKFM